MQNKTWGQLILRLIIGGILIYAAFSKIVHPQEFYLSVLEYHLVGDTLSKIVALWLPWIEVLVGVGVLGGIWFLPNLRLAQLLFAGFTIILIVTLFRGIHTDCGCFGTAGGRISWLHVLGDVILYFLTTLLVIWEQIVSNVQPAQPNADNQNNSGKE